MMTRTYDIVLLTDARWVNPKLPDWYAQQILDDDALLMAGLERQHLRVRRVDWANPNFDWSAARAVVFRTTWDYYHRFKEFEAWIDHAAQHTQLINTPSLIRWNWDKHYLQDLEMKGIRIPETLFIKPGDKITLNELHQATGWDETVLKPAISGGARHTYRLNAGNLASHEAVFAQLLANEAMLLQPFQHNVVSKGEVSLMVMAGKYTHAVLKRAKDGDYRVQDDFGGKAHPYQPSLEEITFAENAVAACATLPVYARVDMIWDNDNQLAVSELELIEPELWLRHHPQAAMIMASAIANALR